MPDTAVAEQTQTQESEGLFLDYMRNRGGAPSPEHTEEKPEQAQQLSAETEKPNPEAAPASEPEKTEQSKFEKRVAEKQRRIDELTKQEKELERRIAAKQTSEVPRETGAPTTGAAPAAAVEDPKDPRPTRPDQSKYTDWAQYEKDLQKFGDDNAAWIARQEWRRLEAQRQQQAVQDEGKKAYEEVLASFETRGSEYATEHPDYPGKVDQFKAKNVSNEVAACLLEAENGPQILDYLMDNPEELRKIDGLKFAPKRTDAIYALKYKLLGYGAKPETDKTAPEKPRSNAPAPGSRLNGSGGAPGSKEPANFEHFRAKRFG